MLKLGIIGCGNNRIRQFASILQDELRDFVKQHNGHIYDLKTLYRAEVFPELLKKNARLTFSTNKDVNREYWGIINTVDYVSLHSRWFSSRIQDENILNKPMYYSKSYLLTWIKSVYGLPEMSDQSSLYDFKIAYHYEKLDEMDELCIIELYMNDNLRYINPFEIFKRLVTKLDTTFPDDFVSAYMKKTNSESPCVRFDSNLLNWKVRDGGYAFYICSRIKAFNGISPTDDSITYVENKLCNGSLYQFNGELDDFNYRSNISSSLSLLEKTLVPNYIVFNWTDLSEHKISSLPIYDTVSVYYDRYSPKDPTIVFSFNYTYQQLDNLPILYDLICQERYNIRDIII